MCVNALGQPWFDTLKSIHRRNCKYEKQVNDESIFWI